MMKDTLTRFFALNYHVLLYKMTSIRPKINWYEMPKYDLKLEYKTNRGCYALMYLSYILWTNK